MPTDYSSPKQLVLGISLRDEATYDNFFRRANSKNSEVVSALQSQLLADGEQAIYLWGVAGCGLTHLLQAACHDAQEKGFTAQYLPLRDLAGYAPDSIFDGLEAQQLVCIDSLDTVIGHSAWEHALFDFYNRMRDAGKRVVFSSASNPGDLSVQLQDLKSRLSWGVIYHVEELDDADKSAALQMRAKARGMDMQDEVAQFILNRAPRDTNDLFYILDRLDELSLREQRKLTIPFVKEALSY